MLLISLALAAEHPVESAAIGVIEGSDRNETLHGPVLAWDGHVAVANYQGTNGFHSAGEVHLLTSVTGTVDLAGTPGVYGDAEHDYLGSSLAVSDRGLIIGADHSGLTERDPGQVHVLRSVPEGQVPGSTTDLVFFGDDNADALGRAVATGDVDGDGLDDVLVGAPHRDGTATRGGAVWLIRDPLTSVEGRYVISGLAELHVEGAEREQLGWNLDVPGDLDGDGRADVVVAAMDADQAGSLWVYRGVATGPLPESGRWDSELADGWLGTALAGGDLDGDGLDELYAGAPGADQGDGRVVRLDGLPRGVQPVAGAPLVRGGNAQELGASLAVGPGLLVGAPGLSQVLLLDGGLAGDTVLTGADRLGEYVAWLPDVDADGVQDAVAIAPLAERTKPDQGVAWVVSGGPLLAGTLPVAAEPSVDDPDGDGFGPLEDCDPGDPRVNPDARETCANGVDDDCDGVVDEDDCGGSRCSHVPGAGGALALLGLVALTRRRSLCSG